MPHNDTQGKSFPHMIQANSYPIQERKWFIFFMNILDELLIESGLGIIFPSYKFEGNKQSQSQIDYFFKFTSPYFEAFLFLKL